MNENSNVQLAENTVNIDNTTPAKGSHISRLEAITGTYTGHIIVAILSFSLLICTMAVHFWKPNSELIGQFIALMSLLIGFFTGSLKKGKE